MANRDPHDVILRPVLTEKGFEGIADKRYIFEVPVDATKTEIKLAVEAVFADDGVKVESVNTVRTLGKIKRQGLHSGRTPEVKKAYVTLKKDSKPIKFFEGMGE
jgi:large subunit ribosomal protein L23